MKRICQFETAQKYLLQLINI